MLYIICVKLYHLIMSEVSTELIKEAVYNLCFEANTCLDKRIYDKIYGVYTSKTCIYKDIASDILKNAQIAYETKLPLCQDTGMVIVFLEIGQEVKLQGEYIENAVNSAVEKCYRDNCFRKSIVKNAVFDRTNTQTNTPIIIHTKIVRGDEVKIGVLIKGAGSENKTKLTMLLPTANEEEIIKTCADMVISSGENSCPPLFIGIGAGSSADNALIMSKEALLSDDFTEKEISFAEKIKNYINSKSPKKYGNQYVLDVKLKTSSAHIACLPVAVTINCHSYRISKCSISKNTIKYEHQTPEFIEMPAGSEKIKEVFTDDIEAIRNLKEGEKILLTGEIYVARDMAHKKLAELIEQNKPLPVEIQDKIIFYAGPCPAPDGCVIGSIGPTTAGRMDKYAVKLYEMGLLATIGKGGRSIETEKIIQKNTGKYFTLTGGIAALLAQKVKKSEIIAFDDLGAEAVYKIYIEKFPLTVEIA